MRLEVAGAQITDTVVEVLENLQTTPDLVQLYGRVLNDITRDLILGETTLGLEDGDGSSLMERLRVLQMIRRDLSTLAMPPDADLPENDTPTATF